MSAFRWWAEADKVTLPCGRRLSWRRTQCEALAENTPNGHLSQQPGAPPTVFTSEK